MSSKYTQTILDSEINIEVSSYQDLKNIPKTAKSIMIKNVANNIKVRSSDFDLSQIKFPDDISLYIMNTTDKTLSTLPSNISKIYLHGLIEPLYSLPSTVKEVYFYLPNKSKNFYIDILKKEYQDNLPKSKFPFNCKVSYFESFKDIKRILEDNFYSDSD